MKKYFLLLAFVCGMSTYTQAVPGLVTTFRFVVGIIPKGIGGGVPMPKSPVDPPEATLDDHLLTLPEDHSGYTLQLVDANDEIVYETEVLAGTTVVSLPSSLSGDYTLLLYPEGNYYFYYYITL